MLKKSKVKKLPSEVSKTLKEEIPTSDVESIPQDVPAEAPVATSTDVATDVPQEEPVDKFAEFSAQLKELLAGLSIEPEAAETIAQAFVDALSSQQDKFDGEAEAAEQETLETIEENVKKLNAQWQSKLDTTVAANKTQLKELHEKVKKVISEDYEAYKTELKNKAALMIETKLAKLAQPEAPKAEVVKEEKVEVTAAPVVNEEVVKLQAANKELKAKVNRLIEEKIALISKMRKVEGESKQLQEDKNIPLKVEVSKPKISEALNSKNADTIVEKVNSIYGDFERLSGLKK